MRVYQQVMGMDGGGLEALERVLGCPARRGLCDLV
jgi:hypothetical protein